VKPARDFGACRQEIAADDYRGKRIRFAAALKAVEVTNGWAGLWLRVDGAQRGTTLAFDNMEDRAVKGATGWGVAEAHSATAATDRVPVSTAAALWPGSRPAGGGGHARPAGRGRCQVGQHALAQNLRRGHYELAVEEPTNRRVTVAFDELVLAI
jgi:hypothetical protein